ncbi:hypothetical protein BRC68_11135 [Halobacteriales archaeon QH_6_64_20]|nr:MAG: hypothetical protein BRC68_11135 [Halobacteriales archaeon QH_6_64_20]
MSSFQTAGDQSRSGTGIDRRHDYEGSYSAADCRQPASADESGVAGGSLRSDAFRPVRPAPVASP